VARKTKVYFATDVHGSSKCFRKFLNAGPVYGADVMILGGDVAGKAIQAIIRGPGGTHHCSFIGSDYEVADGPDLEALEKLIADHGYYPYRADPGELEARHADGTLDTLFVQLMKERLAAWLALADERLRPAGKPLYFMLGNDDPIELKELLDAAPWGQQAEGKVLWLDDDHEMISWGYSNITPWHSYREQPEELIRESIDRMAAGLTHPDRAIVSRMSPVARPVMPEKNPHASAPNTTSGMRRSRYESGIDASPRGRGEDQSRHPRFVGCQAATVGCRCAQALCSS